MATDVSLPHNNSLQALRLLVEERKREVRDNFIELRTALQQCEESVAENLDKLYSDTRDSVESSERTIEKFEEAKNAMQDIGDNKMNEFLQTTVQSIDVQIAEVRRSTALVPKRIQLEWMKDAKQTIQTLCKVISSGDLEPIAQPAQQKEAELWEHNKKILDDCSEYRNQLVTLRDDSQLQLEELALKKTTSAKKREFGSKQASAENPDAALVWMKSKIKLRDKENKDLSKQVATLQQLATLQEATLQKERERVSQLEKRESQLKAAELRELRSIGQRSHTIHDHLKKGNK